MIRRVSTAAVGFCLVLHATSALAGPYYGYDGRNYGELKNAPNYGRPLSARAVTAAPKVTGGGSRKGLTPAALALLDRIETQFGPVKVISGYRPGARIAGSGRVSRHASGNAIDFEAGSRKGAIVNWLVANHKSGGTMTYAAMSHIHVDIGQHFVSLGSGSGRSGSRAYSGRSQRYAAHDEYGYERRGQRRHAYRDDYRDDYRRGYRGGYRNPSRYGGEGYGSRQFASGYATIYR
jgi:hypothetical protein